MVGKKVHLLLSVVIMTFMGSGGNGGLGGMIAHCVWRIFLFTILSTLGVLFTELALPEPKEKSDSSG